MTRPPTSGIDQESGPQSDHVMPHTLYMSMGHQQPQPYASPHESGQASSLPPNLQYT